MVHCATHARYNEPNTIAISWLRLGSPPMDGRALLPYRGICTRSGMQASVRAIEWAPSRHLQFYDIVRWRQAVFLQQPCRFDGAQPRDRRSSEVRGHGAHHAAVQHDGQVVGRRRHRQRWRRGAHAQLSEHLRAGTSSRYYRDRGPSPLHSCHKQALFAEQASVAA